MPKKKPLKGKPVVHKALDGFDIKLNEFGEVVSNLKMDKLNNFLNERVDDKKLRNRDDLELVSPLDEVDEGEELSADSDPVSDLDETLDLTDLDE